MTKAATPNEQPLCLGIEAGATRTVAIAAGGPLSEPVRHEFGPANLWLLDDRQLTARLRTIARAMPRPDSLAIGMAGARTPADHARIRRAASRIWPRLPCYATNDLETGLMAATDAGPARAPRRGSAGETRVLVVSGTGSCCFARRADGRTARFGGWGHLLGDKGSGYDIALRALRAVVHASDGEADVPALGQRILRALMLNEPENLVGWVQAATKADIAALARDVLDAWQDGDRLAGTIATQAAETLASDAASCARLVETAATRIHFVLAGSVLRRQPRFAALVARRIRGHWRRACVTVLQGDSAWGAVELARHQLGTSAAAATGGETPRRSTPDAPSASLRALVQSPTEQRNPRSMNLDRLRLADAVSLMLEEDGRIPGALLANRGLIQRGVTLIVRAFKRGGRLFYVGAGTSGRLGVLDASECPPTFNTPPEMVQGIIAGGTAALWTAVEGAEDDAGAGGRAIAARGVARHDVVVGIAASGRTPFVWGALAEARRRGATTILLCFNPHVVIPRGARPTLVIAVDVGPEILTGSTRLKAGTATKLVLNIFTTLAMVRIGKVRSNLMIDVRATNTKLRDRAVRIVVALTNAEYAAARAALEQSRWNIQAACGRLTRTRP